MPKVNGSNSFNRKSQKNNHNEIRTAFNELNKSRKIAVIFLAFFTVFLFILWGFSTKEKISNSIIGEPAQEESSPKEEEGGGPDLNMDSDNDGLSDWEEENTYNTSPYLEDTDSDGINDKEELERGTNPNCPQGDDCSGDFLGQKGDNGEEVNNFLNENLDIDISTATENISDESVNEVLEGGSDAETLRQMLLEAGIDKALIDAISDEELMQSYQEILQ